MLRFGSTSKKVRGYDLSTYLDTPAVVVTLQLFRQSSGRDKLCRPVGTGRDRKTSSDQNHKFLGDMRLE
jgi:hypothetical protein